MWFYFQGLYLKYFLFYYWNNLHLSLFLSSLWFFLFLTPSYKVLWFFCLYFRLLSYSTFEVLVFLSLHFLFLIYSTRPCFNFLNLAQYFYICWIATNKIWKILLISFQLVPYNSFISFMLSQIVLQLLHKIFFCNFPLFLKFWSIIFHLVICLHQGTLEEKHIFSTSFYN